MSRSILFDEVEEVELPASSHHVIAEAGLANFFKRFFNSQSSNK